MSVRGRFSGNRISIDKIRQAAPTLPFLDLGIVLCGIEAGLPCEADIQAVGNSLQKCKDCQWRKNAITYAVGTKHSFAPQHYSCFRHHE